MKLCGKMIQKSGMPETRPCLRKIGHYGPHTPDFTGLKNCFGYAEIIKRAPDYVDPQGQHRVSWVVKNQYGVCRVVRAANLFSKRSQGLRSSKGFTFKNLPEYRTIAQHLNQIMNVRNNHHNSYKNMKFYDDWNPGKGGSIVSGYYWILKNIGARPSSKYQLHVIKSKKYPYGFFGPSGIVWRKRLDRHDQDVLDLVCDWSEKQWGDFVKQENKRRNTA